MPSAPTWGEIANRALLVTRAQAITPISQAFGRRRDAALAHIVAGRRFATEDAAWQEYKDREATSSAASSRARVTAGAFGGSQMGRLFRDWVTATMSPDGEIRGDIRELRNRARQLVRDNATAAGYINELANQVIGPKGILLQARATTADGKPAKSTNDEIERGWKEWGMPETCSANRRVGWLDLQRQLVKSLAMDGELFLRKLPYFDNAFGFAVQQIDPDLLDENYNLPGGPDRNEIRMGVELDKWGAAVAYHFWTRHPSQTSSGIKLVRERIAASEIIHAFLEYRPGQTRGVSWFAPVLLDLKMLAGIQEAELVATRMGAAKTGFLVQKNPEAWGGQAATSAKGEDEDDTLMETAPGVIEELPPGWEFQGFDPTHPSTAFQPFTKAIRRDIARGLSMAYATMTGDLESVNYSSMRAGILPERDWYRTIQDFLAVHVCRPVKNAWMPMAILMRAIRVDTRLASEYPVEWRGRGWPWVDPANDAQAFETLRKNGLATRSDACAERGLDYEEVIDKLALEEEYAADNGVDVSGTTGPVASNSLESGDDDRDAKSGTKKQQDETDTRALALPRRRTA